MPTLRTFADFGFDGEQVLQQIISASEYGDLLQLVASLTVFSHPITVGQTGNKNLFPVIRRKVFANVGRCFQSEGVMHDDNLTPINAFCWSNSTRRYHNSQYNHIWSDSQDAALYTSLANICVTPAFIAKLTDTNDSIKHALKFRSYELYKFWPSPEPIEKPPGYNNAIWAEPLRPVTNLEETLRAKMKRLRSNRTLTCARTLGWLYSDFLPDANL